MKLTIALCLMITSTSLFAQNTIIWKGGTPGNETSWNEAKNWSSNQVPDEFSCIIIKRLNSGHQAQPIIKETVEATSIEIQSGATLTVTENGLLLIDGANTYSKGITMYGGNLVNKGIIQLNNIEDTYSFEQIQNKITGNGLILVNGKQSKDKVLVQD